MTHFIKVTAKEHVLPMGDTDLRASENTRGKPRQDASRGVAVHTRDGPVPQSAETVARRLRQASQVHPQTREKDTLGDAILLEVTDPGVRLETGRSHRHQFTPRLIAPGEPVRERRVGFETQHPEKSMGLALSCRRPRASSSMRVGTGTCAARVTTRLCWRAATGHTVRATNSAMSRIGRTPSKDRPHLPHGVG